MKHYYKRIEISLVGAVLITAAISALAVATNKLVDSISTGKYGGGDWSIDENEFRHL